MHVGMCVGVCVWASCQPIQGNRADNSVYIPRAEEWCGMVGGGGGGGGCSGCLLVATLGGGSLGESSSSRSHS